jgi:hypothetical protein
MLQVDGLFNSSGAENRQSMVGFNVLRLGDGLSFRRTRHALVFE